MFPPGFLIAGRYRLESRIAAGGVGEVWRAEDAVLGRPVAVKLLRQGYASDAQTLARFRAEARHAGSLTHPAVAQVYDYGEAGPAGLPYLVLELVDGPSLAGVLTGGPLDPGAVMDVVAQVAAGLAAAHAAGLVHRDIKPANLLMGPGGQVKITDFGIAHAAGSAPLTQVGTVVGTPAYLAPERAAGEPATAASDLYSLGIVAFESLTGTPPFQGTAVEIAGASRFQPLPPLPPAVPPPVAALVTMLTANDPARRPGSAAEVSAHAAGLRDAINGGPAAGLSAGSYPPAPTRADGHTAVLADPQGRVTEMLDWPAGPPGDWPPPGTQRTGPAAAEPARLTTGRWPARRPAGWAAALGVAGLVALAGWMLASASGPAQPPATAGHRASGPASAVSRPATQRSAMVNVNAAALVGRPVDAVRQRLAGLGLRPRVVRSVAGTQAPGTVVAVQPSGRVAEGSVITVTAAVAPPGHRHPPGHQHGNGGGQGGGNGPGGD